MDPSSPHTPGRREVQLHGPRPSPLKVSKDSHKIKKPPQPPPPPQPVVIYAVSPIVIHADTSNFMSIVQRLTGFTSGENNSGAVSPAARVAAIEKASMSPGKSGGVFHDDDDGDGRVEVNRAPGVLSPAPGSLPPIPQGFFSTPVSDPFVHDVMSSPWFGFSFTPSPSALLSSSIVSPTNSYDFFSQFWDS